MEKTLIILRGCPGSGKSSFVNLLPVNSHFEADMYFIDQETGEYKFEPSEIKKAHQWCQNKVEQSMGVYNVNCVAVSNTFTQQWEMEPYFELAKKYGYKVFTIIVENRHGGKNVHGVPDEKVQIMRDRFEVKL